MSPLPPSDTVLEDQPFSWGNVCSLGGVKRSGTPTSTCDVEESDSGSVAARSYGTVGNYSSSGRINSLRTLVPVSGITGLLQGRW